MTVLHSIWRPMSVSHGEMTQQIHIIILMMALKELIMYSATSRILWETLKPKSLCKILLALQMIKSIIAMTMLLTMIYQQDLQQFRKVPANGLEHHSQTKLLPWPGYIMTLKAIFGIE